jgi:hypothetical protein
MPASKNTTRVLGAMALAGLAFHAAPTSAQSAKYCSDSLAANAFYSNVMQATGGADVEYHGQFQNQDTRRRTMTATMIRLQKIGNFTLLKVIDRFDLAAYQQKDINLLTIHTTNQAGSGAPTPQVVGATIRFVCTYTGG